jgi:hypothetical protein
MTQLAGADVAAGPETADPAAGPAAAPGAAAGTFGRLLWFALATLRRSPERSLFAVVGIGLAIAAVVVVRTIAVGYQDSGVTAVVSATGNAPFWIVPSGGVRFDARAGWLTASGSLPAFAAPDGWTETVTRVEPVPGHPDVLLLGRGSGRDSAVGGAPGSAVSGTATQLALARLGIPGGGTLRVGTVAVRLTRAPGAGARVNVPLPTARAAGAASGWATLTPPGGVSVTPAQVETATGLRVVSDPAIKPGPGSGGVVYATSSGASRATFLTFDQKFAAMLGAQVGSSDLGLIAYVALALGFVIAVTCFVAAVQERRREFGIMASIGLSDEVLYFFVTESVLVFVTAYVLGAGVGAAVVAVVLPGFFTVSAWLQAAALVAMYLPALAIVAALIPVHRLLQQRPVRLLVDLP